MAFKTNMTTTSELDQHLITAFDAEFIISAENTLTKGLPSLCTIRRAGEVKDFQFAVYSKLSRITSALTEDTEATRQQMSDASVTLTPAEYGTAVMRTKLNSLQSAGQIDLAAARLVATNMRESIEGLMVVCGEAGTNELTVNASNEASTTAGNVLTAAFVKKEFNKLRRAGIPGPYYAVAHNDVIYDLQVTTGTQGWTEINMYADPSAILDNEIGRFGGFTWIDSPLVTVNTDAGSGTVDTYHTQFFGYNAFGYAESEMPGGTLTGPFDNLGRFVDLGWYGVLDFGLVDTNAHWLVTSSSSIGTNS